MTGVGKICFFLNLVYSWTAVWQRNLARLMSFLEGTAVCLIWHGQETGHSTRKRSHFSKVTVTVEQAGVAAGWVASYAHGRSLPGYAVRHPLDDGFVDWLRP